MVRIDIRYQSRGIPVVKSGILRTKGARSRMDIDVLGSPSSGNQSKNDGTTLVSIVLCQYSLNEWKILGSHLATLCPREN
jgi:hypothetical protein